VSQRDQTSPGHAEAHRPIRLQHFDRTPIQRLSERPLRPPPFPAASESSSMKLCQDLPKSPSR
jgi:hypothetical protein